MKIPAQFTAGDSVAWFEPRFGLAAQGLDIDPASWGLVYALRGASEGLDLTGASDGGRWTFLMTAQQSAALNTGRAVLIWYWQAVATRGIQRVTAGRGVVKVRPNLAGLPTSVAFDGRTENEQALAAIEAELRARINGGATVEYTIGQRSLKKEPMAELLKLRTHYRLLVKRERLAGHPGFGSLESSQITFR